MDKTLRNTIIAGILLVSVSVAFYFIYYLPSKDRNKENAHKECVIQATDKAKEQYAKGLESAKDSLDTRWKKIVEGDHSRNERGYDNVAYDAFLKRCFIEKGLAN